MRFVHEGFASLRVRDDRNHTLFIDPSEPVTTDVVALSGGPWAERYGAVDALIAAGVPIVTSPELAPWLRQLGATRVHETPCEVLGMRFRSLAYKPAEPEGGAIDKLRAALRRPQWAAERLNARRRLPDVDPIAWRIELPHTHVFAHLGLALHRDAPPSWLQEARALIDGTQNVLAGYPHGDGDAFLEHLTALAPRRTVLTDQTADLRRAAGLPVELITPVRDELVRRDLECHVMVSGTSLRFEIDDTVKRW